MQGCEADVQTLSTFAALAAAHVHLGEMFAAHQEALLRLDTLGALERLVDFTAELEAHMRVEEDVLLPFYAREPRERRWAPEVFVGEHRRILRLLGRARSAVQGLAGDPRSLRRAVLAVLEREWLVKRLIEHHIEREERVLYPALDRMIEPLQRAEIIRRCLRADRP